MTVPVLWHFEASHFNEKARWALDFKGVAHQRRALVPGLHLPRVLWLSGQKAVPVLVFADETVVDSTRIIAALERRHPEPPLYPADPALRQQALALEDFFDEELGPQLRRMLFHELLPDTDTAAAILAGNAGATMRRLYRALFPAIRVVMKADMRIDAAGAAAGRRHVVAALDRLEAELGPSGYLVGERFSVADLTAAALFAPLVTPPEFPYPLAALPPSLAAFRATLAGRPGYRWIEDTYRRHRGTSAEVGAARAA